MTGPFGPRPAWHAGGGRGLSSRGCRYGPGPEVRRPAVAEARHRGRRHERAVADKSIAVRLVRSAPCQHRRQRLRRYSTPNRPPSYSASPRHGCSPRRAATPSRTSGSAATSVFAPTPSTRGQPNRARGPRGPPMSATPGGRSAPRPCRLAAPRSTRRPHRAQLQTGGRTTPPTTRPRARPPSLQSDVPTALPADPRRRGPSRPFAPEVQARSSGTRRRRRPAASSPRTSSAKRRRDVRAPHAPRRRAPRHPRRQPRREGSGCTCHANMETRNSDSLSPGCRTSQSPRPVCALLRAVEGPGPGGAELVVDVEPTPPHQQQRPRRARVGGIDQLESRPHGRSGTHWTQSPHRSTSKHGSRPTTKARNGATRSKAGSRCYATPPTPERRRVDCRDLVNQIRRALLETRNNPRRRRPAARRSRHRRALHRGRHTCLRDGGGGKRSP